MLTNPTEIEHDWKTEQQLGDLGVDQLSRPRRLYPIKGNEPGQELREVERDNIQAAIEESHRYDEKNS